MKLDIKETIKDTESFCKHLGRTPKPIRDAIKVMKMWQEFIKSYSGYTLDFSTPHTRIRELTDEIKEEFFPSIIKQTVTIEIQGADEQRLRNTIETIECVSGVKDVRPHDARY